MARLAQFVARPLDESDVIVVPDLGPTVAQARTSLADARARPEYAQFASTRERLARQADVIAAREQPRVSAFARVGYGKPGLNALSNTFDAYWLAGVQVQWTPWTWGAVPREREALTLQQQIIATNEAAFTEGLRRAVQRNGEPGRSCPRILPMDVAHLLGPTGPVAARLPVYEKRPQQTRMAVVTHTSWAPMPFISGMA